MKRKKLSLRLPKLKSIKSLRFILLIFIIIFGLFFILREINFQQISIPNPALKNSEVTKDKVLQKINEVRAKNKLKLLTENKKLTNASLIRVEALSTFQDWGEKAATGSGVTRENAVLAVGLTYQAIGSLEYGFYRSETIDDAIEFWLKEKASKETILAGDLKEIGIALKNTEIEGEKVQLLVIIFINPISQSNSDTKTQTQSKPSGNLSWTGPQLFEEVNASRKRHGVNGLGLNDDLCSIASARVHQLLQKGYQDGHNGFQEMYTNKDNAYYRYFEKYNISEFLVFSNKGPEDAVKQWENTLTHQTLLTGGQYTIGCTSAFSGIGVAIAGY